MRMGPREGVRLRGADAACAQREGNGIYNCEDDAGPSGESGGLYFAGSKGTILLFGQSKPE